MNLIFVLVSHSLYVLLIGDEGAFLAQARKSSCGANFSTAARLSKIEFSSNSEPALVPKLLTEIAQLKERVQQLERVIAETQTANTV